MGTDYNARADNHSLRKRVSRLEKDMDIVLSCLKKTLDAKHKAKLKQKLYEEEDMEEPICC